MIIVLFFLFFAYLFISLHNNWQKLLLLKTCYK